MRITFFFFFENSVLPTPTLKRVLYPAGRGGALNSWIKNVIYQSNRDRMLTCIWRGRATRRTPSVGRPGRSRGPPRSGSTRLRPKTCSWGGPVRRTGPDPRPAARYRGTGPRTVTGAVTGTLDRGRRDAGRAWEARRLRCQCCAEGRRTTSGPDRPRTRVARSGPAKSARTRTVLRRRRWRHFRQVRRHLPTSVRPQPSPLCPATTNYSRATRLCRRPWSL